MNCLREFITKKLLFVSSIFIAALLALLSAYFLYNPWLKISLPTVAKEQYTLNDEIDKQRSFSNFRIIAETLDEFLGLKWFDIHIKNDSQYILNDRCFPGDNEMGPTSRLFFSQGSPEKYESNLEKGSNPPDRPVYYLIKPKRDYYFIYSGQENLSYVFTFFERKCPYAEGPVDNKKIEMYAQANMTAWYTKLFIFFLFWLAVITTFLSLYYLRK